MPPDDSKLPANPGLAGAGIFSLARTVDEVKSHFKLLQNLMKEVLAIDEDYGFPYPGAPKPTLLKPGAEKLCLLFRMSPKYEIEVVEREPGGHVSIISTCNLIHVPTGDFLGSGMGSCSTREAKYAYRDGKRKCPHCGKDTILKSKYDDGGFFCFEKKGGCGAKFGAKDQIILDQKIGRVANEELADTYNTILKIGNKRSQIAAVLTVTGFSAFMTQDLEEEAGDGDEKPPARPPVGGRAAPAASAGSVDRSKFEQVMVLGGPFKEDKGLTGFKLERSTGAQIHAVANKDYAAEVAKLGESNGLAFVILRFDAVVKVWKIDHFEAAKTVAQG